MKTKVTIDVNKGEYGIFFTIKTVEPILITKEWDKRTLIIYTNPTVTIKTEEDITSVTVSEI